MKVPALLLLGFASVALAKSGVGVAAEPDVGMLAVPGAEEAGRVALELDPLAYARLWPMRAARVAGFPLTAGLRVDLELHAFELLSSDARFVVAGANGIREVNAPAMRYFQGKVVGEPESIVSLTLFGRSAAGFVRIGAEEWSFAPRSFAPDGDGGGDLRLWNSTTEAAAGGSCAGQPGIPAQDPRRASRESAPALELADDVLLKARIAIESTVEWTTRFGGVVAAQNYTLTHMAQVSTIFATEFKVQLEVPYVLMNAAEPDGYSGGSNNAQLIAAEMRAKWNASPTLRGVFRSAAHVFAPTASNGSGWAYLDVLCDNVPPNSSSYDFGSSLIYGASFAWERLVTSHELGHTFSSLHTQCYVPELDQCYSGEPGCYTGPVTQVTGTIMSLCSNRSLTFHPRSESEMLRPAAETAFPACVDAAGSPGEIRPQDGGALAVAPANLCLPAALRNDDGAAEGESSWGGTAQAAWIKRLTPPCYPFKLTRVDVEIGHPSVAIGRPLRLLVYRDPGGSGAPASATLAHAQDVAVQTVTLGIFNQYVMSTPVILTSGDFYLGFYDLLADPEATSLARIDVGHSGDSWMQADSLAPSGYFAVGGSWMVRGVGGGVAAGSQLLSWGAPCNDATVPGQDFAIYQGTLGSWSALSSVTCSTGRATTWPVEGAPPRAFWVVVPQGSGSEGSYGRSTSGQRAPAAAPCKPQVIGTCP